MNRLADRFSLLRGISGKVPPIVSLLGYSFGHRTKSWFGKRFVQKSQGEVKKSTLLFIMFTVVIAVAWGTYDQPQMAATAIIMWGSGDAPKSILFFKKHLLFFWYWSIINVAIS